MSELPSTDCHGCCGVVDRRRFLKSCGVAALAATGSLTSFAAGEAEKGGDKVRVATVFLMSMKIFVSW